MGDPLNRNTNSKKLSEDADENNWRKLPVIPKNQLSGEKGTGNVTQNYNIPATQNPNSNFGPPENQTRNFTEVFLNTASPDWRRGTKSIKAKLSYVLTHEAFQDVTFVVGVDQERIRAHKFMLLLTSSAFEYLCSVSDESKGIYLPDVDPSAFKSVLKFIYTDKLEVTTENAMHSLYIAKKFDIPALTERCVELLRASISDKNVVTIFQRAKELNEVELSNTAFTFLLKNVKKVINSDDFYELSNENLCALLECDDLNVEELALFQATLRWAHEKCRRDDLDGTPDDLRFELKRAISLIRFPLLTSEEFTMHVAPREILSISEMLELYKYFSVSPANRASLPALSFKSKRRCTGPKVQIYTLLRLQDIGVGPWGCNGKMWQIRFMVDRPISVRGYGLYGSFDTDNPKYTVDIYLESKMYHTKVHASEVVQLHQKGGIFQVNFNELVPVQPNIWYEAGFSFKGPNTLWGARQLSEVAMACGDKGHVTFRFEEVAPFGTQFGGTGNTASYQLPQILFTL